jgi:oxygen-independent coproporphyrinogen-3 oxidase
VLLLTKTKLMQPTSQITRAVQQIRSYKAEELEDAGLIPKGSLYYPTIYYPPIPMYGPSDEAAILAGLEYDNSRRTSVYIHIPFCRSRCLYCHWMVNVGCTEAEIHGYLDCLEREMILWKEKFGVQKIQPRSMLIGGGTPTALTPKQTTKLCKGLNANLDFSQCAQITCETEPGSILGDDGIEKLRIFKDHGVSRISLGVQALDDQSLKDMGRRHSARDVMLAMDRVRQVGFRSVSIDLIYGYPGCTPEKWQSTLETALAMGVDAFQLYRLRIVPHGDKVGKVKDRFDLDPAAFPGVEQIYLMKQLGFVVSEQAGLKETSRRFFSKGPLHDSQYLQDHTDRLADVIGFGASSWSNVQGRFYLNTGESLVAYTSLVNQGRLPINRGKLKTEDDQRRWALTLPLKHNGVSKKMFRDVTGTTIHEAFPGQIANLKKFGLVEEDDTSLRLTARGIFFADEVITQFYHPEYLPFPRSSYAEGPLNPFSYHPA